MKKVKLKLELQYNSPVILTFFLLPGAGAAHQRVC